MDPLRGLRFQDRCARLRAHKPLRSGHIRVLTPIASPVAKELGSRTALAAQTASDLQVYRCRRAGSDRRRHRQPGTRVGRLAPPVPLRIRRLGVRIPPGALCVETDDQALTRGNAGWGLCLVGALACSRTCLLTRLLTPPLKHCHFESPAPARRRPRPWLHRREKRGHRHAT